MYEVFGSVLNIVAIVISLVSIKTSPRNRVIKVILLLLIIILAILYYLLREQFKIYDSNNDIVNQIYFYSSIVLFISAFVLLLKV